MDRYLKNMRFSLFIGTIVAILSGCASGQKDSFFIAPDFRQQVIRSIVLLPVTFDERYAPPGPELAKEIESRAAAVLEQKGYRVSRGTANGTGGPAAAMAIHVDFLFITETYADVTPPPVIDIEAAGRLVSTTGEVLWRDRGVGKVGGAGGDRIRRPVSAYHMALTLLIEKLFDSLPEVGGGR